MKRQRHGKVSRWMDGWMDATRASFNSEERCRQTHLILIISASQDSSDDVRKVQRREKNRIAAQKSRQRQTQKADTLHLVSAQTFLHPLGLCALHSWILGLQP
jgi:hypothetical protein